MVPGDKQLQVDPFEILQSLIVAIDDVVFGLLAAIDVEHLTTFLCQPPKPLLRGGLQQFDQGLAFLAGVSLGEFQRLRLHNFLETGIESQSGNHSGFDGETYKPEGWLGKAKNGERGRAESIDRNAAE